jgi:WD40 repeat protein
VGYLPVGYALHPCFVPDTGELLTYSKQGLLRWPLTVSNTDESEWTIGPPQRLPCIAVSGTQVASDRTGRTIAIAAVDKAFILQDSGQRVVELATVRGCRKITVSPDGRWVVTGQHEIGPVDIWSVETAGRVDRLSEVESVASPHFSQDGSLLAFNSQLLEVQTGQKAELETSSLAIPGACIVAISPDNQLVVNSEIPGVRLLETEAGREICTLNIPGSPVVRDAEFSPDGRFLVLNSNEQHATYIWDLHRLNLELSAIGLGWSVETGIHSPSTDEDTRQVEPLRVQVLHPSDY